MHWLITEEQQKNPGHTKHSANMNCYTKLKYLSILFYKVMTSISLTTDNLPGLEDYTVGHREAEKKSDRTEAKPWLNSLRPHSRQHSSLWRQQPPAHTTQDTMRPTNCPHRACPTVVHLPIFSQDTGSGTCSWSAARIAYPAELGPQGRPEVYGAHKNKNAKEIQGTRGAEKVPRHSWACHVKLVLNLYKIKGEQEQRWKKGSFENSLLNRNQEKNLQGMANRALTRSGMWGIHENDEKVKRPTFQY